MSVMKDINQYLKLRGTHWYYVRRVPTHAADVDTRRFIKCALKTQSLEIARARRDAMSEADNQYWDLLHRIGERSSLCNDHPVFDW